MDIPSWMLEETSYEPERDHDGFITRSLLRLLALLTAVRAEGAGEGRGGRGAGAAMKLTTALVLIVLSAVSRNMFFTWCLIGGFLVRLITVPENALLRIMKNAAGTALLSAVVLLPSVFLGSPRTMLTVSLKVFLSVGLLSLMSATTPWNQITEALKLFRLPDLLIFILDLTLKYIAILGDICCDMLTALTMRSVGRNRSKERAFSGILGVTFLKSHQMAEEMVEAMTCRGFEGEYVKRRQRPFGKRDVLLLLVLAACIALFLRTR